MNIAEERTFFLDDAKELFLLDADKNKLLAAGVKIENMRPKLDVAVGGFITHPARTDSSVEYDLDKNLTIPKCGIKSCILPGSILDFCDIEIDGVSLEEIIYSSLKKLFERSSLVPLIPEYCSVFKFERIAPDLLSAFHTGNTTTPVGLISADQKWCFGWDFDLQYSFICTLGASDFNDTIFSDVKYWWKIFDEYYPTIVPQGQRNMKLMKDLNRPGFTGDCLVLLKRLYRMCSGLHRTPPLLRLV